LSDLDLTQNQFFELPKAIGKLGKLRRLSVNHNRLYQLPNEMEQLTLLKIFSAKANQLVKVPESMGVLTELRELDLSVNRLEALPPSWGKLFQLLRIVNLSDNGLLELPSSFQPPMMTMELDLSKNPIITLPAQFGGFTYKNGAVTSALTAWFSAHNPNDVIETRLRKITVYTSETGIQQGLVNEARLAADEKRGLCRQHNLNRADLLPAGRIFNDELDELDETYSMKEYLAEQKALGNQLLGLERKGRPEFQTQRDVIDVYDFTRQQADKYATRFNPQPEMPVPEVNWWEQGWAQPGHGVPEANAAGPSYPYGGYGGYGGYAAGPSYASYGEQTGLEGLLPVELQYELDQLPPLEKAAKVAFLKTLPEAALLTVVDQMQGTHIHGGPSAAGTFAAPVNPETSWRPEPPPWVTTTPLQRRQSLFNRITTAAKNLNDRMGDVGEMLIGLPGPGQK
jgi:hypothetical protein